MRSAVFFAMIVTLIAGSSVASRALQFQPSATDSADWLVFLQDTASRRTARTCERGVACYAQSFGALYGKWALQYHDQIARGEGVFRRLLKADDPTSPIDRSMLAYIEKTLTELSMPPRDTAPLTLSDSEQATCSDILRELEAGLARGNTTPEGR